MSSLSLDQDLLDAMADAVVVVNEQGQIEQVNTRAETLLGYAVSELVGHAIETLVPARARDLFGAESKGRRVSRTLDLSMRRRDGSEVPVDVTLTWIDTNAGSRVIATARDMTWLRQAEKAVRRSSRLLEACFKHMLTQVVILDREFNFIRVNEAYARATGYEVSYFPGKNHFELFPSDAKAIFERVVEDGEPFQTFARPFVHPAHPEWGVTYWDWTLVPIFDEATDELEYLLFALENVTERVRTAEELRIKQAQLAEAKQFEIVGQLAAGIAHDFNNVLTSILFTYDLLRPAPGTDPAAEELLDEALDVVSRAKTLTYQLLSFGRKQLLRPEILELNAAVRERRSAIEHLLPRRTELSIVTGETEVGLVKVDPAQLDRILLNLASNAADAMPKGGKLSIMTTHVDLDEVSANEHPNLEPGAYVMLSVQDNGVGMDRATRERVFEPFFTTKLGKRNSGLGLASVLGIVKQSGGEIFVHSEPGEGTTFKILFPRVFAGAIATPNSFAPRPAIDHTRSPTATVLVVEDELIIRKLVVEGVRRFGYTVHEATSGEDAWAYLSDHADSISVVLTDIVMSEFDGATLAGHIAKTYPDIRIILMSGHADIDAGELPACDAFIPKPFSPTDIAECLAGVLAQARLD